MAWKEYKAAYDSIPSYIVFARCPHSHPDAVTPEKWVDEEEEAEEYYKDCKTAARRIKALVTLHSNVYMASSELSNRLRADGSEIRITGRTYKFDSGRPFFFEPNIESFWYYLACGTTIGFSGNAPQDNYDDWLLISENITNQLLSAPFFFNTYSGFMFRAPNIFVPYRQRRLS